MLMSGRRLRPLETTPKISRPRTVFLMPPSPPNRDVPPSTTAAIVVISNSDEALGLALPRRPTETRPAIPAVSPEIAASHVNVTPKPRVAQDDLAEEEHHDRDHRDYRDRTDGVPCAADVLQHVGNIENRLAHRCVNGEPLGDCQHRQRHHERRNANPGDAEAIEIPDRRSYQKGDRNAPVSEILPRAHPEPSRQDADKDGERPDVEVDLGAQDDKRGTRSGERDRDGLGENVLEVDNGQEAV